MSGGSREINVTPLIDVLLVLLIIFLVMMPIMVRMETVAVPPKQRDVEPDVPPVVLAIHADLSVTIDDELTVNGAELAGRLGPRLRSAKAVFVDFSPSVPWSEVLHTVDLVRGFSDIPDHDGITVAVRLHDEEAER